MNKLKTTSYRDLSLTPLPSGILVTACDSCGAVGMKEADVLQVPPYYTGRFTTRVVLMEVLSSGAMPVTVVNAVSCEMEPTGREIIRGVQDELLSAEIDLEVLTGSTEENFPTAMTGLGITVVGYLSGQPNWRPACIGDLVYCIGKPKVGAEIGLEEDSEIASYQDLSLLLNLPGVREIIPTGSKGIRYEVEHAALHHGLCFIPERSLPFDLDKSTGPASCLLVIASENGKTKLERMSRCVYIGALKEKPL